MVPIWEKVKWDSDSQPFMTPFVPSALDPLVSLVTTFSEDPLEEPYLNTFLRNPRDATIWAFFLANRIMYKLDAAAVRPPLRRELKCLKAVMTVSPPLETADGGDGCSCLAPSMRNALNRVVKEFLREGRIVEVHDDETRTHLRDLAEFLEGLENKGQWYWRRRYKSAKHTSFGMCMYCKVKRAVAVCARCQCYRYCSAECQRIDWKTRHRVRCFEPRWPRNIRFRGVESKPPRTSGAVKK